jgi:hypothetical protein
MSRRRGNSLEGRLTKRRKTGSGAATSGGVTYEHRVGAFYAAHILAGESRIPGLGSDVLGTQIWLQTDEPVDDVKVVDALGDELLIQAKRSLEASTKTQSEFAKVCDQLVRSHRQSPPGALLSITVGRDTGRPIAQRLAAVLRRAREQPADSAPRYLAPSKAEEAVYDTLVAQLRGAARAHGKAADAAELRALMRRTEVRLLDVEPDGPDERYAIRALERDVVRDPGQARAAWSALLEIYAELDRRRSHIDRAGLQRELQKRQIALREPPDLRPEIAALRVRSADHLRLVRSHAAIRLAAREIKITRAAPVALARRTREVSLAVVGDAGSGKTGCTYDAIEELRRDGIEPVVIAAELLEAHSDVALASEMRINRLLDELLAAWPVEHGVLVIDGLDSARDDATRQTLVSLIERVARRNGRFTVLASLRTFDLRNSLALEQALPAEAGGDEAFRRAEFPRTEHFFIPALTEEELAQLETLAPELHTVLQAATPAVRELGALPFNLSLLAELALAPGFGAAQLLHIDTQIALLEEYWQRRVRRTGSGDDREHLLRRACEAMVAARRLYADRRELQGPSNEPLRELLHDHVLVEDVTQGRETIAFSHNLLYDYAVARMLLRVPAPDLVARLNGTPTLLISARPSLDLHFRWLWEQSLERSEFWETALRTGGPAGLRPIGKTIAPAVAVELARTEHDLDPLLEALGAQDAGAVAGAEDLLRQVVSAFATVTPEDLAARGNLWPRITLRLAERISGVTAHGVRILIHHQLSALGAAIPELGAAARRLLRWAWDQPSRDSALITDALRSVVATVETDPGATEALLREAIEPGHLARIGYEELPMLLHNTQGLIDYTPGFLADCYAAVFGYEEKSDEPTALYDSRIMPLTSTKKQDYGMARWLLGEAFSQFLDRAPAEATRALVAMVAAYAKHRGVRAAKQTPVTVRWRGKSYRFRPDGSYIWDSGGPRAEAEKALASFDANIEARARSAPDELGPILDVLASVPVPASVLAHILRAAARAPDAVPVELAELLTKPALLALIDVQFSAGLYLRADFALLPSKLRRRIENALRQLPGQWPADRRDIGNKVRNIYVGALDATAIVTPPMQRLHDEVTAAGAPELRPAFRIETGGSGHSPTLDELMAERGADPADHANRHLLDAINPLKAFAEENPNGTSDRPARRAAAASLRRIPQKLSAGEYAGAQDAVVEEAQTQLASVAEILSRDPGLLTAAQGRLVADVLIDGAAVPYASSARRWDEVTSWHPSPRISAAEGLPQLAREPGLATPAVLAAIEALAVDHSPEVRFQVVSRLGALTATAPAMVRELAEQVAKNELSPTVLASLARVLLSLLHDDRDRGLALAESVLSREQRRKQPRQEVIENHLGLLVTHHIWEGSAAGRRAAERFAQDAATMPDSAMSLLHVIRESTFHGAVEPADEAEADIRGRALDVLRLFLAASRARVEKLHADHGGHFGGPQWSEADTAELRGWVQVAGGVAEQLYFASGVFQERQPSANDRHADRAQRERLYREAHDLVQELVDMGEPHAMHHVIEMLDGCAEFDPRGVFLLIARAVRSSSTWGYQFEPLAEGLVVRIVKQYVTDHRDLFRDDAELEGALMDVLDIFVDAGWPEARRLVYGLTEIFR